MNGASGGPALMLNDRFELRSVLGEGSVGKVFRAYDRHRRCEVACKQLHSVDAAALLSFKREFRSLAETIHPNLVTLYELHYADGTWFFTMELVDGASFIDHVRPLDGLDVARVPHDSADWHTTLEARSAHTRSELEHAATGHHTAPTAPWSASPAAAFTAQLPRATPSSRRLRRIAAAVRPPLLAAAILQLAGAVRALHAAGSLHRDLKPSNVLVERGGRVVVCDFGLVLRVAANGTATAARGIGTPAYMSPEQAAGGALSEASDWYSVGVMLYESLTGRLPHSGSLPWLLASKQSDAPPAPIELSSRIPVAHNDLCMALLERDPARRPGHAAIAAVFSPAVGMATTAKLGPSDASSPTMSDALASQQAPARAFVGRQDALARLEEAAAASRDGRIIGVFVHGPSAIGKSALVGRFVDSLRQLDDNAVVLPSRCYERESVPYKALDELVDALTEYLVALPAADATRLVDSDIASLVELFPVLRRVPAAADAMRLADVPRDPHERKARAFAAMRRLLRRLAARRSVVLYIDDLQWGDVDSAGFLIDLLHDPTPTRIMLVATCRSVVDESGLVRAILQAVAPPGGRPDIRHIRLDPLTAEEATMLAGRLLERSGGADTALADRIARDAGGNPLFVAVLARIRAASASGAAVGLDDVLGREVDALTEDARDLLSAIVVAGRPTPVAVVGGAARIADEPATLTQLLVARMVTTRRAGLLEVVEVYHDRIRQAVLARLDEGTARSVHRRLALAFESSDEVDSQALVDHWRGAGDHGRASRHALSAALQAERAGAFHRAATYYELALVLGRGHDRDDLSLRMADAFALAGDLVRASEIYLELAERADARVGVELRRRAVEALLRSGRTADGLALADSLLRDVGLRLPPTYRRALASIVVRRIRLGLTGMRYRARDPAEVDPRRLLRFDVAYSTASGLAFSNAGLGLVAQLQAMREALRIGDPTRVALALTMETGFRSLGGGPARARVGKLGQMALELAEKIGDEGAAGVAEGTFGLAAVLRGEFAEGLNWLVRSSDRMRDHLAVYRWQWDLAQMLQMTCLLYMGRLNEVNSRMTALLRDARARGDVYLESGLCSWRTNALWLALDDPAQARRLVATHLPEKDQAQFHLARYFRCLAECQAALYEGDGDESWARIERDWPALMSSSLPRVMQNIRIEAQWLRARCALAGASVRPLARPQLVRQALKSAKRLERERMPWGNAFALLVRAGAAFLQGNDAGARDALSSAEVMARELDMDMLAELAKRRRGELDGGDDGDRAVTDANAWLSAQVRKPDAIADLFTPGFSARG